MRISDWSSDVCSSDLGALRGRKPSVDAQRTARPGAEVELAGQRVDAFAHAGQAVAFADRAAQAAVVLDAGRDRLAVASSDERRVWHECVAPRRYRWSRFHIKKQTNYERACRPSKP